MTMCMQDISTSCTGHSPCHDEQPHLTYGVFRSSTTGDLAGFVHYLDATGLDVDHDGTESIVAIARDKAVVAGDPSQSHHHYSS